TKKNKKLSYKISGLKTDDDKELFGRTGLKLRAEYNDPSFMREKLYFDMLNAIGVPTSQGRHVRVFINQKPIGLFLMTDDFSNKHFLKSMFNNGKKYTVDNTVIKVNSGGSLSYKDAKNNLNPYSYKGDNENANKTKMLNDILVPFMKDVDKYPSTKKLNLDIKAFLRSMALEFLAYGTDNYWMVQGNYFLFKDTAKDLWYFIDSDFDMTFGHGSPGECIKTTLDNYVLVKGNGSSRPLIDNIRSVSANNEYLKEAVKTIIKTVFNINFAGERLDSFAELIKDDVLWDYGLDRVSTASETNKRVYNSTHFEREIASTVDNGYPYPIKKWIIKRSDKVASQFKISIPTKAPKDAEYFEPEYENSKNKKDNETKPVKPKPTSTTSKKPSNTPLPISNSKCGPGVAICASGYCCSQYGWCGKTAEYCDKGCQSEFGECHGKKTTITKTTTKKSVPTGSTGKCGDGVAICASGYCCSKHGWCGKTSDYCSSGCQKSFGTCW
ncbi:carbohydrate-binding module family 18 protein, partial [Piromyces sp. E2]